MRGKETQFQRRGTEGRCGRPSMADGPGLVESGAGPVEAATELLDELAIEPVVSPQCDLTGQPALARPARHRVRRHAQQLRNLRSGQELRLGRFRCDRFDCVLHR